MKVCPSCGTQYTDATLQYCLQDGAPLNVIGEGEYVPEEPITVVRPRNESPYTTAGQTSSARPAVGGRNTGAIVAATVGITIVLLGLGALLAWMMFSRDRNDSARTTTANATVNSEATPSQTPSPSPSPTANVNTNRTDPNTLSPRALADARAEVTEFIADWRSETEAKDIDSYMSRYADTVAYYTNPSASRSEVRGDKQRAFEIYDSVQMEISNISTSVDPSGDTATTTFDKEWEFEGERKSRGKVRSELKLRKVNGEWKIVGERDQRVYYLD